MMQFGDDTYDEERTVEKFFPPQQRQLADRALS
jgi:hypothetical protein